MPYNFWGNNNPWNLSYAGQSGASRGAGGFAAFPDQTAGAQAALNQLSLNQSRGGNVLQPNPALAGQMSPSQLYSSWAEAANPSSRLYNPAVAQSFARNVQAQGLDPNAPINLNDPAQQRAMLSAMAQQETGSLPIGTQSAIGAATGAGNTGNMPGSTMGGAPGSTAGPLAQTLGEILRLTSQAIRQLRDRGTPAT